MIGNDLRLYIHVDCRPELRGLVDDFTETGDGDLAVVIVLPQVALTVVRQAVEVDIRNVITAGYRESGRDGATRERELRQIAAAQDLNLVGSNCIGVIGTSVGFNATFAPVGALPGSISFMSQSGAFVTAALDWARDQEIGFNDVVSMGNKVVLNETDSIEAWGVMLTRTSFSPAARGWLFPRHPKLAVSLIQDGIIQGRFTVPEDMAEASPSPARPPPTLQTFMGMVGCGTAQGTVRFQWTCQ